MKRFYTVFLSIIALIGFTTAQNSNSLDVNGDVIPPEAVIAAGMHTQADVIVHGQAIQRSEWMSKGPWGGNIRGFATDKTNGLNVVAACGHSTAGNGGIWYSEDGGQNWNGSDINNKVIYCAFAHPTQSGTFFTGGKYGIYESNDGGATWLQIAYPGTTIIGLGMQTANTDIMIAGIASNQGVQYSSDGGANWSATNLTQGFMKDFAVSAASPEKMYVAVSGSNGSGLFTSTNGADWLAINPAGSGQCYGIYADPTNADFLLLGAESGIYKSTDGGTSWLQTQATSNFARGISKYNGTYYSAVYGGDLLESTDDGDSWSVANENIGERTWQAIGASDAGALFGSWGSVVLGNESGYALSVQGMNNAYVHCTVYYADRNELWAGSEGSGIWLSTDMGETWQNKSNGLQGWWAYSFAPTNSEDWQVDRQMVATNNGVYYSDDFGENWEVLNQETTYYTGAMIHWSDPDIMWIGGSTGPIKYTIDGGASWIIPAGLPFAFYPRFNLCEGTSGDPRVMLTYEQLATNCYYSDDLGSNFLPCSGISGASYFTDLSVRLADNKLGQMVYLSTDQGVYKSTDGEAFSLCPNLSGLTWCVLGTQGTDVYAGGNNGVFHSADEGETWESFSQGMNSIAIWDLAYGSSTEEIFAGTRGYSVYKYGEALQGKVQGFVRDALTNIAIDEAEIIATNLDDGVTTEVTPFGSHYQMLLSPGTYSLTCTAEGYQPATVNNVGVMAGMNTNHTFYLELATEIITGIEVSGNAMFGIYPNPANNKIYIKGLNISNGEILNQAGQQVLLIDEVLAGQAISIESLPAGVYFVKLTSEQSTLIEKLIIK